MKISLSMALALFCVMPFISPTLFSQNTPSIDSLNRQMDELEKLLGVPVEIEDKSGSLEAVPVEASPPLPVAITPPKTNVSVLPESLQGIEKKLQELEAMVGDLPEEEVVAEVVDDPWLEEDLNATWKVEDLPKVELSTGMVVRYVPSSGAFLPLNEGEFIKMKTLIVVPSGSELVVSFKGKSAIRLGENARAVIGPPENNQQIVDLRNGVASAYLDPDRDPKTSPRFGILTRTGMVEAKGTFYALMVYNGQTYTSVKKGEVQKVPAAPSKSDFAAYVKKSSSKKPLKPAEKNSNN